MEERGGKTIMCSVLFLDIVEYSRKSVSGQISLKDRFNSYLSKAIGSVPIDDRIILDTGDGAAINFLGDVEDALKAALSLRESILKEDPSQDPPLLVRMGINLGPVRLVRDINGQPNIVGDGINVAQRIMGFAEADQILVSRSYYDAVSRLSPQYTEMFSYQGSRTDKHVREHEVYAIGHLGEKTAELIATNLHEIHKNRLSARLAAFVMGSWNSIALRCGSMTSDIKSHFAQADSRQRVLYGIAVIIPVVLIGILLLKLAHQDGVPDSPSADQVQATSAVQPASAVASAVPAVPHAEIKPVGANTALAAAKPVGTKPAGTKPDIKKGVESKVDGKKAVAQHQTKVTESGHKEPFPAGTGGGIEEHPAEAHLFIACHEGTKLFVDGAEKGKVMPTGVTVAVSPGKHKIIVTSKSGGLYAKDVEPEPGKTVHLKPNFCD